MKACFAANVKLTLLMVCFMSLCGCGACHFEYRIMNRSQDELSVVISGRWEPEPSEERTFVVQPDSEINGYFKANSKFQLSTQKRRNCYLTEDHDHWFGANHLLQIDWTADQDSLVWAAHHDSVSFTSFYVKADSCE